MVTEGRNLFNPAEVENRYKIGAISFLFADQGIAKKIVLPEKFKEYGKLFIKEDDKLGVISNATSRIGCFTFYSNEPEEYFKVLREFEDALAVYNEKGEDILIHNIWE